MPHLRPFLCIRPTPSSVCSPIIRPSESYQPSGDRPTNVLSCFPDPASHMQVCTHPRTVRLVVLVLGVGGEAKETAPPAMVLSPSSRRQASPGLACLCRRSSSILDSCGARLSVCPPLPPPPFPVQPYLFLYSPSKRKSIFVVAPRGCFDVSGPRPCPPPPPLPYSMVIISGSRSPLMGQVEVFTVRGDPAQRARERSRLPRVLSAGPKAITKNCAVAIWHHYYYKLLNKLFILGLYICFHDIIFSYSLTATQTLTFGHIKWTAYVALTDIFLDILFSRYFRQG